MLPQGELMYSYFWDAQNEVLTGACTLVSCESTASGAAASQESRLYTLMLWLPLARSLPVRLPCSSSDT